MMPEPLADVFGDGKPDVIPSAEVSADEDQGLLVTWCGASHRMVRRIAVWFFRRLVISPLLKTRVITI